MGMNIRKNHAPVVLEAGKEPGECPRGHPMVSGGLMAVGKVVEEICRLCGLHRTVAPSGPDCDALKLSPSALPQAEPGFGPQGARDDEFPVIWRALGSGLS
jgi:hypothetical protein